MQHYEKRNTSRTVTGVSTSNFAHPISPSIHLSVLLYQRRRNDDDFFRLCVRRETSPNCIRLGSHPSLLIRMLHFDTPTPSHISSSSVRCTSKSGTSVITHTFSVVVLQYSTFSHAVSCRYSFGAQHARTARHSSTTVVPGTA